MRLLTLAFAAACTSTAPSQDTGPELPAVLVLEPPPTLVEVDALTGQIHVVAHDENTVEIEPTVSNDEDGWGYEEDAGLVRVFSTCPNGSEGCSTGFALLVPATQQIELSTASGKVVLNAGYAGAAVVSTKSGGIEARSLGGAALDLTTETGFVDIEYDAFPASVTAVTGSSDIALAVPKGSYTIDATTNGAMTFEDVSDGSGPEITLTSTSGDIEIVGQDPAGAR